MTGITILGATGSIGLNTLEVIKQHPSAFEIIALTAHQNVDALYALCLEWQPRYAVMADPKAAEQLEQRLKLKQSTVTVLSETEGLTQVVSLPEVELVMAAIVGSAGLLPTLAAAKAGKRVLLANKEALVMSGALFMETVIKHQAALLPIDSEHNAVFQCLPADYQNHTVVKTLQNVNYQTMGVAQIILTASGGPFRGYSIENLHHMTPDQACAHPNWKMGRKISVDSATLMNKGLEVIEACWLFSVLPNQIEVIIHPQSIIHSLVEYLDGSMLAQLSYPDMRTPIAHALAWPQRMSSGVKRLKLAEMASLEFELVDLSRFPCLKLAYEAMTLGGTSTTILNAANEVAVQAFLQKQLRFTAIPQVIETTLSHLSGHTVTCLEDIFEDDTRARELAFEMVSRYQ